MMHIASDRKLRDLHELEDGIWLCAAETLGWSYSESHRGYVHPEHFDLGTTGSEPTDFPSHIDAEEACIISGIVTSRQALTMMTQTGGLLHG
ncbi:hypothetical protein BWQ93_03240 [Sphingopyxis sp. QXT-31]|uniref:hypothetical protein n=1 Tax=Sphingopyxis sp. QXT-31 TaxID=1357916 RepID=UPI000979567D|nr:hypothetical protein [Sphingopyxis sp. QXT-31]APZ97608.1 hypothetical protein BWQ93_03240 [Sphingopyxis sp. QXT-31]